MTITSRTSTDIRNDMIALANTLEAAGNLEGAADVRNDIATLSAPRPVAVIRCDNCGGRVSDKQAAKYDALGVDWAHCSKCDAAKG